MGERHTTRANAQPIHLSRTRVYKLGEPGSGLRPKGKIQDFYQLRAECREKRILFKDPQFPATDSSLYFSREPDGPVKWMRPMEMMPIPRFFVEGESRFDVNQGPLGNCWFLAAVANLTLNKKLFSQVIPRDQEFDDNYAGIFHFRFWQYGRWIDVVIDDRLPKRNGGLLYVHSTTKNEFWSSLLEKAYAKLHGSYEALISGLTSEAMVDFTGGFNQMIEMRNAPDNLFEVLLKACERDALIGCTIMAHREARTSEGLVTGHSYSVTAVKYVNIATPPETELIPLLRVRNPWGDNWEWNRAWSDESDKWETIPHSEKERIGFASKNDGEFWISFDDFKKYFHLIEICHLSPDALQEEHLKSSERKYEMHIFEGEWFRGVTAGGFGNNTENFSHNPQYRITLNDPDEDDDKCTVIVALKQKNRRLIRKRGNNFLPIGLAVYQLSNQDSLPKPLDKVFFKRNRPVKMTEPFTDLPEVTLEMKLLPGDYCIIASTYYPNEEGEFIIRVFSENKFNMVVHDEEVDMNEVPKDVTSGMKKEDQKEEDEMRQFFSKIAGDDKEVDWKELKQLLHHIADDQFGFSKEICRSMIAMKDTNKSGKLGFYEFLSLWNDIRLWKKVFEIHDKSGSGTLSASDLHSAFRAAGYKLNNDILKVLMHRYGTKDSIIAFDDFLLCAVKLKTMIDIFHIRDPERTNNASFSLGEWVATTLYS